MHCISFRLRSSWHSEQYITHYMQGEPTRLYVCEQNEPSTSSPSREGLPPAPGPPNPLTPPAAPEDPQKVEEEQRKTLRKTRRSRIKELEDTRLVKGSGFRV